MWHPSLRTAGNRYKNEQKQEPLPPDSDRTHKTVFETAMILIKNGMDYGQPQMINNGLVMLIGLIPDRVIDWQMFENRRSIYIQQQEEERKNENTTTLP